MDNGDTEFLNNGCYNPIGAERRRERERSKERERKRERETHTHAIQ